MSARWLLLLHQIPPSPPYFRAKVLRRLNGLGAYAIKNSVYILPYMKDNREDLEWIRREIVREGGEAWLFETQALTDPSDQDLEHAFQAARSIDYKQLLQSIRAIMASIDEESDRDFAEELRKLKRRFNEICEIDFFQAPEKEEVERIMESIERKLHHSDRQPAAKPELKDLKGRIWVTRRGVKVDRVATAWLIRRFIDPDARVLFVDPDQYAHSDEEIRFDMYEGEFTHEGELCTFEVLVRHLNLRDPALAAMAEIVHDIDLKDEKFQRRETAGVAAMISGLVAMHAADERRIEEGAKIFDAAYAGIKSNRKR